MKNPLPGPKDFQEQAVLYSAATELHFLSLAERCL
jgi:hypothetical protein